MLSALNDVRMDLVANRSPPSILTVRLHLPRGPLAKRRARGFRARVLFYAPYPVFLRCARCRGVLPRCISLVDLRASVFLRST